MTKEHHILYVPGLDDAKKFHDIAPFFWKRYGVTGHVHRVGWKDEEKTFTLKLKRLLSHIDTLLEEGHEVSLIGQSAGGSAVFNAFGERRDSVRGAVNICGRLHAGSGVFPTLENASRKSQAFYESVLLFEEKTEPSLTQKERQKMMTVRALYDEVVPHTTTSLKNGVNITVPMVEHTLAGNFTVLLYTGKVMNFLKTLR